MEVTAPTKRTLTTSGHVSLVMLLKESVYGHRVGSYVNGVYRSSYQEQSFEVVGFEMTGGAVGFSRFSKLPRKNMGQLWKEYQERAGVEVTPLPSLAKPRTRKGYDIL